MRVTVFSLLTALSASLVCAQGYSKECSDIYLQEGWLVATCPKDDNNGRITSSVYLPNKIANDNAVLEWAVDVVEKHIANYDGHLLSNLAGAVTHVTEDSSYPIPSEFEVELDVSTLNNSCASYGGTIKLTRPTSCWYLNVGVENSWACGNSKNNQGWEIVGYSDKDCTSDPVAAFTQENQGTCLTFSTGVKGFSVTPLWNAD
ncbi:hypothetical protein BA78_7803 [Aspergillus fumigatus]|nr:hypothetical protein BA78_7803 [Aspergillus fumigatus]